MSQVDESLTTRREENRPLENSSETKDSAEETKSAVAVEEGKKGNPPTPPSSSEETSEPGTQKIEIQSPIEAMIEKSQPVSGEPESVAEEKQEKKPRRTGSSKKRQMLEPQAISTETSSQIESKSNKSEPVTTQKDDLSPIRPREDQKSTAKGIAHFKDNVIKMAGGFKLHAGDEIRIGDKEFELRHLESSRMPLYWGILALGIIVLFFIFQFGLSGYKDTGKIVGVVIDRATGAFLPNAQVQIKNLGKKVQSNDLGFFIFELLPPGTHELQVELKGFNPVKENAVIVKKQTSTTVVELSPVTESGFRVEKSVEPKKPLTQSTPGTSKPVVSSKNGSIKVESNVPGVIVFLDGKYLGVGNDVYSDISPGTHSVKLSKDNYQDWSGNVSVKEKSTARIKANLLRVESSGTLSSSRVQEDYLALAQKEYDAGNFGGAVENYTKGLLLNSDNPEAYLGRGNSYLKIGESNKALADFSQASKLFEEKGNYNKAVLGYTQLLSLSPGDLNALYSRGSNYIKIGEYEKAISDLKKVTEHNPKFFNGFMELGNAQYYSEDYKGAVESYSKAKKLNPNSKQVYVKLALAYTGLKDKSGAKKNYEKFKELTTLADRENMKDNQEWVEVLKFLGEETEKEF